MAPAAGQGPMKVARALPSRRHNPLLSLSQTQLMQVLSLIWCLFSLAQNCVFAALPLSVPQHLLSRPASDIRSEMPVRRVTAAGMCSPCGSAMSLASARVVVVPARPQPISMRCPCGAAAVAWQSTTSTSSCESDSETVDITLRSDETSDVVVSPVAA